MAAPQSYANHVRFDPSWHFFVLPALLLNMIVSIVATVRDWDQHALLCLWWVFMSVVVFFAVGRARVHAMTVQDRVIRLEERLRYARLLTPEQLAAAEALTLRQLIGLRFASDAELPALMERTLNEQLTPKQIKQAVTNWRADTLRV